jgi:hypothetical protein
MLFPYQGAVTEQAVKSAHATGSPKVSYFGIPTGTLSMYIITLRITLSKYQSRCKFSVKYHLCHRFYHNMSSRHPEDTDIYMLPDVPVSMQVKIPIPLHVRRRAHSASKSNSLREVEQILSYRIVMIGLSESRKIT